VVFSANPVTNRRDKILVNAVEGSGDHLVSGIKDGVHYEFFRSGSDIPSEFKKNPFLLSERNLKEILEGAKKTEQHYGVPVDLEWAIDQNDQIQWLQVRPITTLLEVHYNELDTVKNNNDDVWTLGNIGEMMPGVVTPLTYSVSAEAIDYGMTMLADKSGAFPLKKRTEKRYIQMFYNRLFVNMSHMMDYPKNIWLNKADDVQFALSGKAFPGITAVPEALFLRRVINFFKQIISTSRAQKHLKDLKKLESGFHIELSGNLEQIHQNLEYARHLLGVGFGHHLMTSAQSGTLYSAFMRIMTGDKRWPTADDHHIATMLLLNIPNIESADAVKSLERFITYSPAEALHLLQQDAPPEIMQQFKTFIERHGHRCVRESELGEKTWEENPQQLIYTLQTQVRIGEVKHARHDIHKETDAALNHLSMFKRTILRSLIPTARKAVARREITKAFSIRMVNTVRKGYQALAQRMLWIRSIS
jgi:pyruvate,water dikinase